MLKPLFELRFMTELGMMPDLLMCRSCGVFLPKRLYFSVEQGCFFCTNCGAPQRDNSCILIPAAVLQAMRHIVFADFSRLFRVRISLPCLRNLSKSPKRQTNKKISKLRENPAGVRKRRPPLPGIEYVPLRSGKRKKTVLLKANSGPPISDFSIPKNFFGKFEKQPFSA